ncbi:unnamed protein product [Orchesella dallaii]|uniref:Uncharacterized protein n=1 Tax=Orchesella dallaii TaxID=48710 RepID=A0ABP1RDM8_9HEXA
MYNIKINLAFWFPEGINLLEMENKNHESSASSSTGVRDILKQKILAQLWSVPTITNIRSIPTVVPVENRKPKLPALLPLNIPNNVSANEPKSTVPHKSAPVLPNHSVTDQNSVPCSDIQRQSDQKLFNIEEKVSKSPSKSDHSTEKLIMTGKSMEQPKRKPDDQSSENNGDLEKPVIHQKSVTNIENQRGSDLNSPKAMKNVTKSPLKADQPSDKCITKLTPTDNSTENKFNQQTAPPQPPPNKLGPAPVSNSFVLTQHQTNQQQLKIISEKLPENSDELLKLRLEIIKLNAKHEEYKLRSQTKLEAALTQNDNLSLTIKKSEVEFQVIYDILTELFTKERKISNDNEMLVLEKDAEVSKNENLLKDIDTIQRDLKMLRKEKEKMNTLMNDKCADFDEVRKSYEEFEQWLTHHLQELQVVANKKREEISNLNKKCESLGHLLSLEISRYEMDTKELNNKVKTLEETVQKLEIEVKNEKQKNEKMQRDLSVLNEAKKDLHTLLKLDAQAAEKDKQSYEERLQIVLNEKDSEIINLEQKQQAELEKLASEMDTMRVELEKLAAKKESKKDAKNVKTKKLNKKSAKTVADSSSPAIKLRISLRNKQKLYDAYVNLGEKVTQDVLDKDCGEKLRNKRKICETVETKGEQVGHDEQVDDGGVPTKISRGNNPESEEGTEPTKPLAVEIITLSDSED